MADAPKVYAAINAVQSALKDKGIEKGRRNEQQGYAFRGIDDVYSALAPALAEYQLCMLPRVISRNVTERQTRQGGTLFYVTVEVEYDLVSVVDGSKHTIKTFGEAMDSGDKATNKAMSAAYKYAAIQAFSIPVEGENPDADAVTHEVAPPKPAPPAPYIPPPPPESPDNYSGGGDTSFNPATFADTPSREHTIINDAQRKMFYTVCKSKGLADVEIKSILKRHAGVDSTKELTNGKMDLILALVRDPNILAGERVALANEALA